MNAIDLPGCIDHEQILTAHGVTVYRWPNPNHPDRWIETTDVMLVPLNSETRARLSATYESHVIASIEAGLDMDRSQATREDHDRAREIYLQAFAREMQSRGQESH